MDRVHSYIMLLDLECDAVGLDMFHHLLMSNKDDHSPILLAHIEYILVGIFHEADGILLDFLISTLYQSQTMGSPSSTPLSKRDNMFISDCTTINYLIYA